MDREGCVLPHHQSRVECLRRVICVCVCACACVCVCVCVCVCLCVYVCICVCVYVLTVSINKEIRKFLPHHTMRVCVCVIVSGCSECWVEQKPRGLL